MISEIATIPVSIHKQLQAPKAVMQKGCQVDREENTARREPSIWGPAQGVCGQPGATNISPS